MLIEFEDMTEINNFDQVRRLKEQEKNNPVQWETNHSSVDLWNKSCKCG
jgi:hypothetical protein